LKQHLLGGPLVDVDEAGTYTPVFPDGPLDAQTTKRRPSSRSSSVPPCVLLSIHHHLLKARMAVPLSTPPARHQHPGPMWETAPWHTPDGGLHGWERGAWRGRALAFSPRCDRAVPRGKPHGSLMGPLKSCPLVGGGEGRDTATCHYGSMAGPLWHSHRVWFRRSFMGSW
jgi:hypothetical protein